MLLEKMKFYVVAGKYYKLVKSYLDGCYQNMFKSYLLYSIHLGENITGGKIMISFETHLFSDLYKWLDKFSIFGTKILLYADDASIIITSQNMENFQTKIYKMFGDFNNWFKVHQLILNYNETHYLRFNMKNSWDYDLKLIYQDKGVKRLSNKIFSFDRCCYPIMEGSYRPNDGQISCFVI